MRQKFTLLTKTLLLLCALMAGSGSAWAEESEPNWSATLDESSKLNTTAKTYTVDKDHVWTYEVTVAAGTSPAIAIGKYSGISGIKFGESGTKYYSPIILSTDAFEDVNVTKVSLFLKHNGKKAGTLTVKQGNITIGSATTEQSSDWITVTSSSTNKGEGGTLSIQYEVAQAVYINKIEVWYEAGTSVPSSEFAFTEKEPSITFPATKVYTPEYTVATGYTGSITYEITDNTAGATLDATNGSVTVAQEGTVTVKATAAAVSGLFSKSTDEYTLKVIDSRSAAGLEYETATQTVYVGETLNAPILTNPNNLTVTYSSSDDAIATVDAAGNITGVAVGTATITATFAGNETYASGSASYTITVKKASPAGALFWESVSGHEEDTSDGSSSINTEDEGLDSDNWKSFSNVNSGKGGCLKFSSKKNAGEAVTGKIALTGMGILTYKVKQYGSSEAGDLSISVEGATATGDVSVTGSADWVEKTVTLTNGNGEVVITFSGTANSRIYVDDILVVAVPATLTKTVSSAGWATYAPEYAVEFGEDEAFIIDVADDTETVLTGVSSVPAGTPVLLKGAGKHTMNVVTSSNTDVSENCLKVSDGTVTKDNNVYVLANDKYGVGFYLWIGEDAIPEGKIYMEPNFTNSRSFISLGGEATGVAAIETNNESVKNEVYNFNGQRIGKPSKGLYIVNGKKVIVK